MKCKVSKNGFTLIELVVIVAILAILATISIPVYTGLADRVKQGADIASATEIANTINLYNAANPTGKIAQTDLDSWSTETDVSSKLHEWTPKLAPDNFAEALARITVNGDGIATVSTTIS